VGHWEFCNRAQAVAHEAASIEVIRIANLAKMLPIQQSLNSEDNRNNISAYSPSLH
jgi:hypothetical protein